MNKEPFQFKGIERESEEREAIAAAKEAAAGGGEVLSDLDIEIVRLEVKRKKIAENSSLSLEAPALIEQLDAQVQRLKDARRAGWKKEEKKEEK